MLKENYGIESTLHIGLLRDNTCEYLNNKESQYTEGIISFECEKLIGKVNDIKETTINMPFFWEAYNSAHKHFGKYSFQSIPSSSKYEEDVLSFLGDLGYQKKYFVFCP